MMPRPRPTLVHTIDFEDVMFVLRRLTGVDPSLTHAVRINSEVSKVQRRIEDIYKDGTYVSVYVQAAMLLRHLTHYCLTNKSDIRIAWLLAAVLLEVNGFSVSHASSDQIYEIVRTISTADPSAHQIADVLRTIAERLYSAPADDFMVS